MSNVIRWKGATSHFRALILPQYVVFFQCVLRSCVFNLFFIFAPCEAMPLRRFRCQPPSDSRVIKVGKMCLKLSSYPAGLECCGFDEVSPTVSVWSRTTSWGVRSTLRPQAATAGFVVWNIFWIIAVLTRYTALCCVVTSGLDGSPTFIQNTVKLSASKNHLLSTFFRVSFIYCFWLLLWGFEIRNHGVVQQPRPPDILTLGKVSWMPCLGLGG